MNEEEVKKMKVSELKEALSTRGLSTSGRKEELASRLLSSLSSSGSSGTGAAPTTPSAKPAPKAVQSASASTQSVQDLLKLDPLSVERMRARQARFGTVTSERLKQIEEEETRKKRAALFS
jgi:hypothetical protein